MTLQLQALTRSWVDDVGLQRRLPAKAEASVVDLVGRARQAADDSRLLAAEPAGGARPEKVCSSSRGQQ
jgi:hypothetical protein